MKKDMKNLYIELIYALIVIAGYFYLIFTSNNEFNLKLYVYPVLLLPIIYKIIELVMLVDNEVKNNIKYLIVAIANITAFSCLFLGYSYINIILLVLLIATYIYVSKLKYSNILDVITYWKKVELQDNKYIIFTSIYSIVLMATYLFLNENKILTITVFLVTGVIFFLLTSKLNIDLKYKVLFIIFSILASIVVYVVEHNDVVALIILALLYIPSNITSRRVRYIDDKYAPNN